MPFFPRLRRCNDASDNRLIHRPECPDYMDRNSALQVMLAAA